MVGILFWLLLFLIFVGIGIYSDRNKKGHDNHD